MRENMENLVISSRRENMKLYSVKSSAQEGVTQIRVTMFVAFLLLAGLSTWHSTNTRGGGLPAPCTTGSCPPIPEDKCPNGQSCCCVTLQTPIAKSGQTYFAGCYTACTTTPPAPPIAGQQKCKTTYGGWLCTAVAGCKLVNCP